MAFMQIIQKKMTALKKSYIRKLNESWSIDDDFPQVCGGKVLSISSNGRVVVVDNHRLVYRYWKSLQIPLDGTITIVHIDAHPDAVQDSNLIESLPITSKEIDDFEMELSYENFIYPFLYEYGNKASIINLCHDSEKERGFSGDNCKFSYEYYIDISDFLSAVSKIVSNVVILDIDLDYFYPSERQEGKTIEHAQLLIEDLYNSLKKQPDLVTIATSPSCYHMSEKEVGEKRKRDLTLPKVEKFLKAFMQIESLQASATPTQPF